MKSISAALAAVLLASSLFASEPSKQLPPDPCKVATIDGGYTVVGFASSKGATVYVESLPGPQRATAYILPAKGRWPAFIVVVNRCDAEASVDSGDWPITGGNVTIGNDYISIGSGVLTFSSGYLLSGTDFAAPAINVTGAYYVQRTQVVGERGAAIANATDGADVITQLNTLLSRLRDHGLIGR